MKKTNDSYCIVFEGKRIVERYYRDESAWLKVSNRGRVFRMTAEQVLNHVLPALAFGDGLGLKVTVEHYERPYWQTIADDEPHPERRAQSAPSRPPAFASARASRTSGRRT